MRRAAIYAVGMLMLLSSAQAQTVMTREEAGAYASRAAVALNTSVHWLTTFDLPAGEEVADTEQDKIDAYALMGLNYEDIVSIVSFEQVAFHWLEDINYRYPCGEDGDILVNAFSGTVLARGSFPTGIMGPLSEEQAITIASRVINSFYGSVDHEWQISSSSESDGSVIVFFDAFKPSIYLQRGRRRAYIEFSPQGFIRRAYFYPLQDDIMPSITLEQAKQLVVNALEEAYTIGKETYFILIYMGTQKTKLPKVRFICLGKHPEAAMPDSFMLPGIPVHQSGEGLYFYYEDDFLQSVYVYAVLATVEIEGYGKIWTYYLVDANNGEVEGFGLTDIYFITYGSGSFSENKINKILGKIEVKSLILNNRQIRLQNTLFENNRVYIAQDYLSAFKVQLRDGKLYGRNGEICLTESELRQSKGKLYISLRRICEVAGIRLWWDKERKMPILRAEWLEPRRLLAQRQRQN